MGTLTNEKLPYHVASERPRLEEFSRAVAEALRYRVLSGEEAARLPSMVQLAAYPKGFNGSLLKGLFKGIPIFFKRISFEGKM